MGLPRITPAEMAAAVAAYKGGESLEQIADRLPMTDKSLWERFKRAGVPMRPGAPRGAVSRFYRGGRVPGAQHAHRAVATALRRGVLERPALCQECGDEPAPRADGRSAIHAHHDDYRRPLEVRWLCWECHFAWHELNRPAAA